MPSLCATLDGDDVLGVSNNHISLYISFGYIARIMMQKYWFYLQQHERLCETTPVGVNDYCFDR